MLISLARGALAVLMVFVATTTGTAAAQAAPGLTLQALSFAQSEVDATAPRTFNELTWTVRDPDPGIEFLHGTVTIRMRSTVTGALMGHEYAVNYYYGDSYSSPAEFVSGTLQESTYRYRFPVPRYADAATTTWEVVGLTAVDSAQRSLTAGPARLRAFGYRFTATTVADASGPAGDVELSEHSNSYVFAPGTRSRVGLDVAARDAESGFWKGTLRLAGPRGESVTTSFQWTRSPWSQTSRCGDGSGTAGDMLGTDMTCGVVVHIPANAAAGTWRVAHLVLVNNAGVRTTYRSLQTPAVTVTSNTALWASGFAASPETVNTWRDDATGEITMTVAGARRGIASVTVEFERMPCHASAQPASVTGTLVTVAVRIFQGSPACPVEGVVIVDGAGQVALYGSRYGAPDPGLTFRQLPHTTPPAVLGASIEPGEPGIAILTVRAEVGVAPIDSLDVHLYDGSGTPVIRSGGRVEQQADGTLEWQLDHRGLAPGEYTAGFTLGDAAGLRSWWGMPELEESQDIPGGPVTLTIVEL